LDTDEILKIEDSHNKFLQTGKPVDLNILWYNVLRIVEIFSERLTDIDYHIKAQELWVIIRNKFFRKFWNRDKGYLNHCVDIPPNNSIDSSLRPNQILCLSLPFSDLLMHKTKFRVLNIINENLFTFKGIRTLSTDNEKYNPAEFSDGAISGFYWGQFITAFLKLIRYSKSAKHEAKFLLTKFE